MRAPVICAALVTLATSIFAPVLASTASARDRPTVESRSAVVLDAATGEELFAKDADEVRAIASTTKIFVAMAVRKRLDLDGWTEISKVDAQYAAGGARTRLDIGQKFRNKDLLRAMLLASDNRAPTALGRAAGLSPDELVAAMNDVARRLRLKRTRFTDPTGLRGNVSTAREMAIALRAVLADDVLRAIMRQDSADVVSKDRYARIHYGTTNQPLVVGKWDVIGGKTGYTHAAGYCFVTGARFDDREVVMAFLGANGKLTRFADFNRVAAWLDHRRGPATATATATAAADSDDDDR
jgi:D-alanyl-D-alanine carboxypeptidase